MGASRKTIREFVAGKMGRLMEVTIASVDGSDHKLITVTGLSDFSEDDERLQDAYLCWNEDGDDVGDNEILHWRRIVAANTAAEQVHLNRVYDDDPPADTDARIISLMNPDDWNKSINEALIQLYFRERSDVTLDDTKQTTGREYVLPSYVQFKGQVLDVYYRETTTGHESPVPRYKLNEAENVVTLKLIDPQMPSATFGLVVEANRFYPPLNEDDWGTTCPTPLWQAAVQVAAIHKVNNKYGERFKRTFAQDLAIAERNLSEMRASVLPKHQTREYTMDDDWDGPDIDIFFESSGWAF